MPLLYMQSKVGADMRSSIHFLHTSSISDIVSNTDKISDGDGNQQDMYVMFALENANSELTLAKQRKVEQNSHNN